MSQQVSNAISLLELSAVASLGYIGYKAFKLITGELQQVQNDVLFNDNTVNSDGTVNNNNPSNEITPTPALRAAIRADPMKFILSSRGERPGWMRIFFRAVTYNSVDLRGKYMIDRTAYYN